MRETNRRAISPTKTSVVFNYRVLPGQTKGSLTKQTEGERTFMDDNLAIGTTTLIVGTKQ
jgi:hypothetical protein